MAERRQRHTQLEQAIVHALEDSKVTEQLDVMMPDFGGGNTVTITEFGTADLDAAMSPSHRASLVVVAGTTLGLVYTLKPDTVIGRDPLADIVIEDSAVSRRHARVLITEDSWFVEDLGSANGTFLGRERIQRRAIENGDRIQLGARIVLRFGLLDETEERMLRQLYESSTRDALTGAFNKKHISERLVAEVAHSLRHRTPLEVVVLDLDRFKDINDNYGHLAGDAVLREVAARIQTVIRSEDVFGRFGGEEFVVISRAPNAVRLAERIRVAIEGLTVRTPQGALRVTVSAGVACLGTHGGTPQGALRVTVSAGVACLGELDGNVTAESLIAKADERLYEAKHAGRNRVRGAD